MNPDLPTWKALEHILDSDKLAALAASWEQRAAAPAAIAHRRDLDQAVRLLAHPVGEPPGGGVRHIARTDLCPAGDPGESVRRYLDKANPKTQISRP